VRSARSIPALIAAALAAVCLGVPAAFGDGDPASDFLLSQSTFLSPFDGHVAASQAANLVQMLAQTSRRGFSLKVAVIVTPYDLGSVPILFRKPKTYAKFLGEEDYYYWKSELLVVMPNGYGIYGARGVPAADRALVASLRLPDTTRGTALVEDAERVVRRLAARRGIVLALRAQSSSSSMLSERVEIGAAVVLAALAALALRYGWRRWPWR
jgi:hypothetical protein